MLRQRNLSAIGENPGITVAELRARLPNVERPALKAALDALLRDREIEPATNGRYRAISRRPSVDLVANVARHWSMARRWVSAAPRV
jgi:hypothetical protein